MPLYATDAVTAKDNIFIKALFLYRKKRLEIEHLRTMNQEGENSPQIADACWTAIGEYQKAIQYAIRVASSTNENKLDQKDFRDWLCLNRKMIMGVFLDLSDICGTVNETEKTDFINEQLIKYDREIVLLIDESETEITILPSGFDGKKAELDQAKAIIERNPNKLAVLENYARRFYDFLSTLIQHKLLENWYKEESNCNWLQVHCLLLGSVVQNLGFDKQVEFEEEWGNFLNANKSVENKEQRKVRLNEMVEQSIVLCFQWEKMTVLEKMQEELQGIIKYIRQKLSDAKKNVTSISTRLKDILYTISFPVIIPALWVADKISGETSLDRYWGFLREKPNTLKKFVLDHPFIVGGMFILATGAIASGILGASVVALGAIATISTEAVIGLTVTGGLIVLGATYTYSEDIAVAEKEHTNDIEETQNHYRSIMTIKEHENAEKLKNNKKIFKKEKEKEESNEVREVFELRVKQQARAKQKEETHMINHASKINENKQSKEKEMIDNIQNLFSQMNPDDIKSAENEHQKVLTKMEVVFAEVTKQQASTEKQLQENRFELNNLDMAQEKIHEKLEEFARKKQTPTSSFVNSSEKMIEVKFNDFSSAKEYQAELLKIEIGHSDANMKGRCRKIEFLSDNEVYIMLSTHEWEIIKNNKEIYEKLLNTSQSLRIINTTAPSFVFFSSSSNTSAATATTTTTATTTLIATPM
jgi:hypothetical protein